MSENKITSGILVDYSKLSDAEINAAVAKRFPDRFIFNDEGSPYSLEPDSMAAYSGSDFDQVEFDPCNNPADAWPIILKSRLYIDPIYIKDWCVTSECDSYREIHANPLRAAMIVFLMMQESE